VSRLWFNALPISLNAGEDHASLKE